MKKSEAGPAPATRQRVGRIRASNEARILKAAIEVFAARGYEGATVAQIAAAAALPKANLHYYFATKEAIYRRVITDILEAWLSAFDLFGPYDDPAEAIALYVRTKMTASFTRPEESRIFARELLAGAPVIKSYLETELRAWVQAKSRIIEAWAARGLMAPVSPPHLFFLIWATTQTFADFAVQIEAVLHDTPDASRCETATREIERLVLRACGIATADPEPPS